ncbi:hypothetical protein [Niabella ginsengisoli]|uniref:DUF4374 domain-containing protein n=1 Tax=Niabella ginsengisoli TaxID=522298 RepID=A0ABS9SR10_9BACT|nr:hypothetical protein [Niabella ginsengisoli]MCH5600822.1 hypothetical protein [Niabella ginsengisoli]
MTTRKILKKASMAVFMLSLITACNKNDDMIAPPKEEDQSIEHRFVRLLVSDETSTTITFLQPFDAKTTSFNAKYPLANLYPTASGRYAAVLYGTNNLVEVFDNGLLSHDDHIDIAGEPKWASITATGLKPTHFKSKGRETLIFNDGDGTLSVGNDADFNTPGAKFKIVNAGLVPHHGAMAQFTNGNYAVTWSSAAGKSPTRVKIINKNGSEIHASTKEVGNIHGNASDGQYAVFGAYTDASNTAGGALVVAQDGTQTFVNNPDGFGAARLGTILYAETAKKFIGYSAAKGAYLIDIAGNKMTGLYTGADAIQCKVDYAGKNLLILTADGKIRIYDLAMGTLKKEGNAIGSINTNDTYKPVLEATERFAYIALPASGEVHQISLQDFGKVIKHKVSAKPVRLALFGFENSEAH